jgi:hypothetical protein
VAPLSEILGREMETIGSGEKQKRNLQFLRKSLFFLKNAFRTKAIVS